MGALEAARGLMLALFCPMAVRRSIPAASLWMIILTMLLTFVPLLNGLIGGGAGGYVAGSFRRALAAAVLPALFVAVVLAHLLPLTGAATSHWFAGLSALSIAGLSAVSLLIGAAFGGYLAGSRREEQLGSPPVSTDDPRVQQDEGPKWLPRPPGRL